MPKPFQVLASRAGDQAFVIAIRRPTSEWHYFDDQDTLLDQHPEFLREKVRSGLPKDGEKTLNVRLSEEEERQYYSIEEEIFWFNGNELKTSTNVPKQLC